MKAYLKNYRQSPRKVRLVADMIRGKEVEWARRMLAFGEGKSAPALLKLLDSALANARNQGIPTDRLMVKEILVDLGLVLKRMEPKARGQGAIIRKRSSRISLTLGELTPKKGSKGKAAEAEVVAVAPKAVKSVAKKVAAKKTAKKATK
jgi:large subunit ribosomal protein L22